MKLLQRFFVFSMAIGVLAVIWHFAGDDFRNQTASEPAAASKPTSKHAEVGHIVKESDLNTVKLSPEAVVRLGIELHPVEIRSMPRSRPYGADLVLPTGAAVIVSTPFNDSSRTHGTIPFIDAVRTQL